MMSWFREVDRALRGEAARVESLRDGIVPVSGRRLLAANLLLAVIYGVCMGFFALFNREAPDARFLLASMVKVPALFFCTLAVTFPSLYVFNALAGSRLTIITLSRLMMATLAHTTALLAAFGPISPSFR